VELTERLKLGLTFTSGETAVDIPGGAVRHFSAQLHPWGFEAEFGFLVSLEQEEDPLFTTLTGTDGVKLAASIASCEPPGDEGEAAVPLSFRGLVTGRRVEERVGWDLEGSPVISRLYTVQVQDTASVLWRQHQPCELRVASTLQELLDAHKAGGLQLAGDWKPLTEERAVITVPCGHPDTPTSFYDFVAWLCDRYAGTLEHDYPTGAYRLVGKRSKDATPSTLRVDDVEALALRLPSPARHAARVRNGHAVEAGTTQVDNADAVTGTWHEHLVRTPLSADTAARAALEKRRLAPPTDRAHVTFQRFPVVGLWPGKFAVADDGWSPKRRGIKVPWRVVGMRLSGRSAEETPSDNALGEPDGHFTHSVTAELELASCRRLPRIPHSPPRWPLHVEGKVVSVGGEDEDRTWLAVTDEATSRTLQTVMVPLWNKVVPVPFEPGGATGGFFFPPYKGARVLLALDWDGARVVRHLDSATGAATPKDGQGNRLVFGKQPTNGTWLEHAYVDGKPVLTVKRALGKDVQSLVLSEGKFLLEQEEDATATEVTPKADLSIEVEAAKGRLNMEVKGGVEKVSKSFDAALGGSTAALDEATESLSTELTNAETALRTRVDTTRAELEELLSGLGASLDSVASAVTAAKSDLLSALEQDALSPQLSDAESLVDGLLGEARSEFSRVRALLEQLSSEASAPLAEVTVRLSQLEASLKSTLSGLQARLRSLLPPG
jgi:hypothetical protein